jgi:hypothetical protein
MGAGDPMISFSFSHSGSFLSVLGVLGVRILAGSRGGAEMRRKWEKGDFVYFSSHNFLLELSALCGSKKP